MTASSLTGAASALAHVCSANPALASLLEGLTQPLGRKSIPTPFIYELETTSLDREERDFFENHVGYRFLEGDTMPSGAALFSRIVTDPDYYVDRAELSLLEREEAIPVRDGDTVTEFGPGDGHKTAHYLNRAPHARGVTYQAVDVSQDFLDMTGEKIRALPQLAQTPRLRCRDFFAQAHDLERANVILFLGTTISNFEPELAVKLLRHIRDACLKDNGVLMIGQDGNQDIGTLQNCYDDRRKHTAAFVMNGLRQLRRDAAPGLNLQGFRYKATFDQTIHVMRMGIESLAAQRVYVGGCPVDLAPGEFIQVGQSRKYPASAITAMAGKAGFVPETIVSSAENVNLHMLRCAGG